MKIPKSIKIAGLKYKIVYEKDLGDIKGYSCDGRCYIGKGKIAFSFEDNVSEEYKELVFWHEITHLLFYISGIGKSNLYNNEDDVHKFSVLLHSFLKDNKSLK